MPVQRSFVAVMPVPLVALAVLDMPLAVLDVAVAAVLAVAAVPAAVAIPAAVANIVDIRLKQGRNGGIDHVGQTPTHYPPVACLHLVWRHGPRGIDAGHLSQRFNERHPV
jgi:hypothetical protein